MTNMSTARPRKKKRAPGDLSGLSFAFFGAFSSWPSYHPGPPEERARRRGATVRTAVDDQLDYLVLGDYPGHGRAEAAKKAERLHARARKAGASPKTPPRPQILDEAAFCEMVRVDLAGKT